MSRHVRFIRFLKTTAIGGIFFLLPLIVLGALIGQVVPIVLAVAEALGEVIPVKTPAGIALLILLAIVVVILLCFAAGLLARRSFGQKISKGFEKNLMLLFPRYAIFKEQMKGSIGSGEHKTNMKPVLIQLDDLTRLGFEIDRGQDNLVTVFLPGAPDPWSGQIVFVEKKRVESTDIEFGDAMAMFERLGRHSAAMMETTVTSIDVPET